MLHIVSATPRDPMGFRRHTMLGRSLPRVTSRAGVAVDVTCDNARGLPDVYNAALARAGEADVVAFVHDDVWLDDYFLPERLADATARFPVVGVSGNVRRVPRQPSWVFPDTRLVKDDLANLSGAVSHLMAVGEAVSYYGPAPRPCKLLDGVFLAVRAGAVRAAGVAFDPQFPFHFYDMDFCRACERAGLEMGTWPIALTHASGGRFGSPEWHAGYEKYLAKWGD